MFVGWGWICDEFRFLPSQKKGRLVKLIKYFLQILLLSLLMRVSLAEENLFVSFANSPTPARYDAIITDLKVQTAEYTEWSSFQRNYKEWAKFLRLVETSDALAIDLAIKLAPKTDGGNLEDVCRAVGKNIRPYPELILRALQKNQASEYRQSCMLTLLPESTVDKTDAMISELEARVAAISIVKNPELADYREKALMILYDQIYFLRGEKPFLRKGKGLDLFNNKKGSEWTSHDIPDTPI